MLSNRFMRVLAQFDLHNMRGLDEATEMLIAGVIKTLTEEVGMPLLSRALSLGRPSRRTLARAEKRLAADVYLSVVRETKNDCVEWIALMVDHGKRSGIEYFVKLIIYAALDRNGTSIIKYFFLDVDKSNHTAKDCASVIQVSLKRLVMGGLDLSNTSVHAILGDTGGKGAVQNIHPPLKEIEVMSEESKRFNCQLHALSRGLQKFFENTFGK